MLVALTGGSGFIGRHLVQRLVARGHELRCLSRHSSGGLPGSVPGSLDDPASLRRLVDGTDIVIHIAGLVAAANPADFARVNLDGSIDLARVSLDAGVPRFLLVSSLAASKPGVSAYAASKRNAEHAVASILKGQAKVEIVRPPAVYGPGDRATLPIFEQMAKGLIAMPAAQGARFSMIYVEELAELLAKLVDEPSGHSVIEPDDGMPGGYDWTMIAAMSSTLLRKRVVYRRIPRWTLCIPAAASDGLARLLGRPLLLASDKLGELYEPRWLASGCAGVAWKPQVQFHEGARRTLLWYAGQGWLKAKGLDLERLKPLEPL